MLVAYHNDPQVRRFYLSRVKRHALADDFLQNFGYWRDGKGCAVGCTLHGTNHAAYETELGIPEVLAYLEDALFEGMSSERSRTWPQEFLEAPRLGADLALVWPQFVVWLLTDRTHGVIRHAGKMGEVREAIWRIAQLHQQWAASGVRPSDFSLHNESRIEWAVWASDEERAAASAAQAAAQAANAGDVARVAAQAAGAGLSTVAVYEVMANKLLELLKAAPIAHEPPQGDER